VTTTTILSTQARRGAVNADPTPRRSALTLDIVRDEAGFKALQPFWDVLVEKMETRSPSCAGTG
jgi:hypothetical protein